MVFVCRSLDTTRDIETARESAAELAEHGRLCYRSALGVVTTLVESGADGAPSWTPTDVMDPDVSYDGQRVVFAGFSQEESGWRIFEQFM